MPTVKEIGLGPGYYFSPGYYRDFWTKRIETTYSEEVKHKHVMLKPYREMWVGAIIAAAHTKLYGVRHFVAIPPDEPPDVYIAKFPKQRMPSGRLATGFEVLKVEITRCSLTDKEELIVQIAHKNTQAYKGMTLAVYLYGHGEVIDLTDLKKKIDAIGEMQLAEILIIMKVDKASGKALPTGTYAQVFLYPEVGQTTVSINDDQAFFSDPPILTANGRGVSTDLKSIGKFRITPPVL